jgi:tetratricopeptide (TPR) repeat protein
VFDRSFNLPQLNNGGRAALLALSLFVPSATRPALMEVAGFRKDKDRLKESLKRLSSLWLVRSTDGGQRVAVAGLTRDLTKARLDKDQRAQVYRQRFVKRFLQYAETNAELTASDLNAIEAEKDNILTAIDIAFEMNAPLSAMLICGAISDFLTLRGYWDEVIRASTRALGVARELAKSDWIAVFTSNIANIHNRRGDSTESRRLHNESLEIERKLGNRQGTAASLGALGALSLMEGNLTEAEEFLTQSLNVFRQLRDKERISECLEDMGDLKVEQNSFAEARVLYDEALGIAEALGDKLRTASVKQSLGMLAEKEGESERAAQLFREAMNIFEELGSPVAEEAQKNLQRVNESIGETD